MFRTVPLLLLLLCAPASLRAQASQAPATGAAAGLRAAPASPPLPLDARLRPPPAREPVAGLSASPDAAERTASGAMARGAVIGAALGGAWGLYLDLRAEEDDEGRGLMTPLGLLGGALNGALIGLAVHAVRGSR